MAEHITPSDEQYDWEKTKTRDASGSFPAHPPTPLNQATSGSNTAGHKSSMDSIAQPRIGDMSSNSPSTFTKLPASGRQEHLTSKSSPEPDYFSQNTTPPAMPHGSAATRTQPPHLSPQDRHNTDDFVENAREELYGASSVAGIPGKAGRAIVGGHLSGSITAPLAPTNAVSRRPALPQYPNQSYAALQAQVYPQYHHAPYNSRSDSSTNPQHPISSVTHTRSPSRMLSLQDRRSGTNTNPNNVPSLFTPSAPTTRPFFGYEGTDERSPYPSPYLHPVQLQPPRTVTNARKEVDVFSGRKMINHYEILDELGRGVHGKVKLARDLDTGDQVAIKIVQRYSKKRRLGKISTTEDKVKKEVAILKKAQHPNVVRMLEVIDDPEVAQVYIVLEFCELKEINWRIPGTTPIVILENRRLEQESQGLPADDLSAADDKTILAVTRRLEEAHIRPVHNHRTKSASHIWSLEYGGDSDSDSDEYDPEQVTPSGDAGPSDVDRRSIAVQQFDHPASRYNEEEVAPDEQTTGPVDVTPRRRPSTSPNDASAVAREADFGSFNPNIESGYSPQWQRWSLPTRTDSFEENRGRRKTSTTESLTSQLTEIMQEEIPEDYRYVPTMTIAECRSAFRDALTGLDYLHYHGIVHRDIKPANLLRTREHRVKISDFGVSYLGKPIREGEESADTSESESKDIEEEAELAKTVGTPAFYAPELCYLDYTSDTPPVTGQIDVWALGVTLYCLLFARTPFLGENEFMLMRKIAEQEVFIPRMRLKAVDVRPARSPSVGLSFRLTNDKRLPDDFSHEYIDDELYDLLKKLFVKDPKKRITIKEIKHHPWILRELPNPTAWPDETDPARYEQGRKIEISSKEVEDAVIPINFVKRIKSITSRAGRALGLGGKASRSRAQSSANSSVAPSMASSVQSLVDVAARDERKQEERKHNLRPDESIFAALKASRDRDLANHPLSRSVTASPDPDSNNSESDEPLQAPSSTHSPTTDMHRPSMPERQTSELSTTASIRTIRPSDMERGRQPSVASIQEDVDMPVAQTLVERQTGSSALSGIFGGAGRSLMNTIRNKEHLAPLPHSPTQVTSSEHGPQSPYGGPSVALTNTSATGHVDIPASLKDVSRASSPHSSPNTSRKSSLAEVWEVPRATHHEPSKSAVAGPLITEHVGSYLKPPLELHGGSSLGEFTELGETAFDHAMESLGRRRAIELEQFREQIDASRNASRHVSRPTTASGQEPCPPSPDDDEYQKVRQARKQTPQGQLEFFSPKAASNAMKPYNVQPISSTSSDDQLASGLSESTSYPSVQSVVSADTSLPEMEYTTQGKNDSSASSEGTISTHDTFGPRTFDGANDEEYEQDDDAYAVETDEDDDSDGDEGLVIMSRRKSHTQSSTRGGSGNASQVSRRRQTTLRRRTSTRSGSAHTMRKIRSRSSGEADKSL